MMDYKRYWKLEKDPDAVLTEEEQAEGWHRCPDWDFMLVGPNMPELGGCSCPEDVS
jgi:hypothetical protein